MGGKKIKFNLLHERPDLIPQVRDLFVKAWDGWYGAQGGGDIDQEIALFCQGNPIPSVIVAVAEDGALMGAVALKKKSALASVKFPWLSSLVVVEQYRNQGVASQLVAKLEDVAKEQGFKQLYVASVHLTHTFKNRGWVYMDKIQSTDGLLNLYEKKL